MTISLSSIAMLPVENLTRRSAPTRISVLIVDDEIGLLEEMQAALTKEGFNVIVASSAAAALEAFADRDDIGVVLLDVRLPDMDGLDLIEAIASRLPAALRPRTVLFTGGGTMELVIRAIRAGAFDFLEKPMPRRELVAAVRRAVDSWTQGYH